MKISIVVPVYNVENFLEETLESVLSQNVDKSLFEIILINDGSTDYSEKICKKYKESYRNIKYHYKKNEGVSAARNVGISLAQGEYIYFLDSDDIMVAGALSKLIKTIESLNSDVYLLNYNLFYMRNNRIEKNESKINNTKLKNMNGKKALEIILLNDKLFSWYPWQVLVKKSILENNEIYFIKGRNYEDMMWTPLLFFYSEKVTYIDIEIINYRIGREGQITKNINFKNLADQIYVPIYIESYIKEMRIELEENTYLMLMQNVSNKYFLIPFYANRISKLEKMQLLKMMKDNKKIEKYKSTTISKIISLSINIMGYSFTTYLANKSLLLKGLKKYRGAK